jgi:hypothetical protein
MSYHVGDELRATATFKNLALVLTDPTTVTISIEEPDGTLTPYTYPATVDKLSTGVFYKDFIPDAPGRWKARAIGTGAVAQVDREEFIVLPL